MGFAKRITNRSMELTPVVARSHTSLCTDATILAAHPADVRPPAARGHIRVCNCFFLCRFRSSKMNILEVLMSIFLSFRKIISNNTHILVYFLLRCPGIRLGNDFWTRIQLPGSCIYLQHVDNTSNNS